METLGAVLALLVGLLLLLPASALAVDPRIEWHTLETPHFVVHFHDGLAQFAERAGRACEAAHQVLVPDMAHAPSMKTQVVIQDDTDDANGSALVFGRPVIHLLAVPPDDRSELNDYDEFLWNLIVHEYTHILHIDQVYGVPEAINDVFGRIFTPNAYQPSWFIEGYAVFQESRHSSGGRVRSSLFDMQLRTELLEGSFFSLADMSNRPTVFPRGTLAYLYGGRLLDYIADRHGDEALIGISRDYGGRVVPWAVNYAAKDVTGSTWVEAFPRWKESLERRFGEQLRTVRERGVTPFTRLTFRAEGTDDPKFGADGRLYYIEASADRQPALRSMKRDGSDDRLIRELNGDATLALSPDGRSAVIAQPEVYRQFYAFHDLYRVELETGHLERLTFGERALEPSWSPDGRHIVVARRRLGGNSDLALFTPEGRLERVLYTAAAQDALYTPRFSPDGKFVAFSEHRENLRDIRLVDVESGKVEDITRDRAVDLEPTFDPSGRYLLFASDRTGIYNLYARDLESGATFAVTNAETGAFKPVVSRDGRELAFLTFTSLGYDVASMPFAPESWRRASVVDLERPAPTKWESRELYSVRPYDPLETLAPTYWLPLLGLDPFGTVLGATVGGADVVGQHAWNLSAGYGLTSHVPSFAASYSYGRLYPSLSASTGSSLFAISGAPAGTVERQSFGSVALRFPFTEILRSLSLSVGYELRYHDPYPVALPHTPDAALPFIPLRGLAATLNTGASYSNAQRFANSISPETGFAFAFNLRTAGPELGSQFTFSTLEASATRYLRMPWLEHHVAAVRVAGGAGIGDLGGRKLFNLGGIGIHDPVLDALQLQGTFGPSLRGYPPGAFAGNRYLLIDAEYRFPLFVENAGFWTLPLYLRRLHAAFTFDAGNAADTLPWTSLKPSVGVELREEIQLGYYATSDLRIGYARGLAPGGINDFFITLGSSF